MRHWRWPLAGVLLTALATGVAASDWFTRGEKLGVKDAAAQDLALYEKGQTLASLHVGDCYFHLERYREGVAVFRDLRRKPDRNYAAAATVREAEGLVKLGHKAEARTLFAACLNEFPEAFLDVDLAELCRAWLKEIGAVSPEPARVEPEEAPARGEDAARSEIRELEKEIADLRKRIAELRKLVSEGD